MMVEFMAPYGPDAIAAGLAAIEPVRYSVNGNRSADGQALLARLEALAPALGITRVGDISQLSAHRFPVFQTARPNVFQHAALGANTGSQGKGPTPLQAKLSCMMEAVEAYCEEPRGARYVRGSYSYLSSHYPLVHPTSMSSCFAVAHAQADEPLLWSWAYHVEDDAPILVPAQAVYCYVLSESYGVRDIFPQSSNGLASGSTILEAVVHGLYELIERMYHGYAERGGARIDAVDPAAVEIHGIAELAGALGSELELQLYPIQMRGLNNLPMFLCMLVGDGIAYKGWGCAGDVDTALSRAVSEALQVHATHISGSREDLHASRTARADAPSRGLLDHLPGRVGSTLDTYRAAVLDRTFESLDTEYRALVSWLHDAGFETICVANLTRRGVDIPVVKVIVPGLPATRSIEESARASWTSDAVIRRSYGFGAP